MKLSLTLILLALVVVGTGLFVKDWDITTQAAPDADAALQLQQLSTEVADLKAQLLELNESRRDEQANRLVAPAQRTPSFSSADIDAAVARWMEANGDQLIPANAVKLSNTDRSLGEMPVDELLELVRDDLMSENDRQALWKRLAKIGRFDEVLEAMEALAAANPYDPDIQVELATSYLQKIFDVGSGPLAGKYAMLADQTFAKAIELDNQHIEARLMKAMSLSEWPAFFNKQPQAIAELQELVEIQSQMLPEQQQSMAYLSLGNLYLQTGDPVNALAAWRQGLLAFPNDAELLAQVQLNE